MASGGFIKLYRSLFSHPIWKVEKAFDWRSAWIDLIQSAAYAPTFVIKNSKSISLNVGELVASRRELSERWRWSETAVKQFLSVLEENSMIIRRKHNGKPNGETVVFLCNYADLNGIPSDYKPPKSPPRIPQTNPQGAHGQPAPLLYIEEKNKRNKLSPSPKGSPSGGQKEKRDDGGSASVGNGGDSAAGGVVPDGKGGDGAALARFGAHAADGSSTSIEGVATPYGNRLKPISLSPQNVALAPSEAQWGEYARSIDWDYPEEYTNSFDRFEQTKRNGQWLDEQKRVITDWQATCRALAYYWAKKSGRLRDNFRPIDSCMADCERDGIEPHCWREEYAAFFKMKDVSKVDDWYLTWAALAEDKYSLACKILAWCIKNHRENRQLFKTEYRAELVNAIPDPQKPPYNWEGFYLEAINWREKFETCDAALEGVSWELLCQKRPKIARRILESLKNYNTGGTC